MRFSILKVKLISKFCVAVMSCLIKLICKFKVIPPHTQTQTKDFFFSLPTDSKFYLEDYMYINS